MYKKILTLTVALVLCGIATAQNKKNGNNQQETVLEEWHDIEIFEQNKLYPRANVVPYAKDDDIEKNGYAASPYYVSLNGEWLFSVDLFDQRPVNVEQKDFSTTGFVKVNVPDGRWKKGGSVVKAPQPQSNGTITTAQNYVATYYKEFDVPKSWKGYMAYLNIQAKSACYVWVNNEYVGYSEDARDISEFELSKHLKIGKTNNIIVQVVSTSDGSLLENRYPAKFNGITSDVFIVLKPLVNVMDYSIVSDYNPATKSGVFFVNMDVFNATKKGRYYVEVEIWKPNGKQLDKMGRWMAFDKKNELQMKFERSFGDIKPWTAETPNLYTLVIRLRNEKMELVETVGTRFGFRTVQVDGGRLLVNGSPVTLRGALYAFYDANSGTMPSQEKVAADLRRMKQNNINAVRPVIFSPAAPFFYELCDQYGLYVVSDANLHPHSTQAKAVATDKGYINMFVSRVQNMYERLKNHPSVIVWSLADSPDNGVCMENAYRTLKQKDKTRPVLFSGAGYSDNTDIIAPAYIGYDDLKLFSVKTQTRPLLMNAYGSPVGNSYGNIEPLWQLVRGNASICGGFADFWNPVDSYAPASASELHRSALVSDLGVASPMVDELRNIYRLFEIKLVNISPDAAEFSITNYMTFLTLNDYILEYTIFSNLKNRIIEGEVSVDLPPSQCKNFKLKIPALTLYSGENLFIRFTVRQRKDTPAVPKGTELGTTQFPLPMKTVAKEAIESFDRQRLFVSDFDSEGTIRIFNDDIDLFYNLSSAEITALRFLDRDILVAPPTVNLYRTPTDNDRVDKNAFPLWQNLDPSKMSRTVIASNYRQVDSSTVAIDAMLRYSDAAGNILFDLKQSVVVLFTGDVLIDNEIVGSELIRTLPRVGMQLQLPNTLDTVRWFGFDKETYSDRNLSGISGTYKSHADNLLYKYIRPQSAGNRSNTQWLSVQDGTVGLFVDIPDSSFNFSISPYSDRSVASASSYGTLSPASFRTLNVDLRQSGVGSTLAGIDIDDSHLITSSKHHFRVHLRPYRLDQYNPYDFLRVLYPIIESSVLPMPVIAKNRDRFDQPMTITISSPVAGAEIRYTLDGSTPDQNSPLYKKPFVINGSTYVKAKCFKKDATPSFTVISRFNFDYIVDATFVNKANTPYNFNQETMLFDGENGQISELSRGWLGFSGNDLNVLFQLSKAIRLQNVVVTFAHVPDAWAFAPSAVQVLVSSDGVNFSPAVNAKLKYDPTEQSMNSPQLVKISVDINQADVKYVRLVAKNMGRIPSWHKAKGLRPWIMVDEVQLNEVID